MLSRIKPAVHPSAAPIKMSVLENPDDFAALLMAVVGIEPSCLNPATSTGWLCCGIGAAMDGLAPDIAIDPVVP